MLTRMPNAPPSDPMELCAEVEHAMQAAETSDDPLSVLGAVIPALRKLRRVFRHRRQQLAELEPRLKAISTQMDALAQRLGAELADCWQDIDHDIRDLQNEREACRELLLRLSKNQQVGVLTGENCTLQLQIRSRLEVPPHGSGIRRELETLLRSSPLWVEMSDIRPLQLMRLWQQGGLHPHLAHRISKLCRLVETLVVRPADDADNHAAHHSEHDGHDDGDGDAGHDSGELDAGDDHHADA